MEELQIFTSTDYAKVEGEILDRLNKNFWIIHFKVFHLVFLFNADLVKSLCGYSTPAKESCSLVSRFISYNAMFSDGLQEYINNYHFTG
jgi:hypothetical protein